MMHDLACKGVQSSLHRITFDLPAVRVVVQSRIVAKRRATRELDQQAMFGGVNVGVGV